ncbi:PAS-domain containing protein [Thalassobius sp. Cn5-15]|uniref:PAS-domain containing protein n=1 Tax=Thalassobius sp. Cn5-15 TaxID=2917763 RepID=UPI001EF3750F|nr:PAS-domain containing protein [Thalassobius sp. Cn5-15]MCG7493916.1 PAS-domain containing protein [Thalassobius sp. Cn5-15]
MHEVLATRFPNLPEAPPQETATLPMILESQDAGPASRLFIEAAGHRLRITLLEKPILALTTLELFQQRGWESQLARMRAAVNYAPYPIWQTTTNGRILWTNRAYQDLMQACGRTVQRGPRGVTYPELFSDTNRSGPQADRYRACVTLSPGAETLWYEVKAVRSDLHTMHYATDINAIVQSEKTQAEFVQTLTKTFAQLSIGLAVFDRNRNLSLFNPALTDMTGLAPAFLARQPDLRSFFDALRDAQVMPEPRDYHTWHADLATLIDAAADGRYMETWTLPSGQMYRVSGRPHPDGAIVFLFEDISAAIMLSRQFRADMALNQSVLDQFIQPIAVFGPDGTVQFTNAAYDQQWTNPSGDANPQDLANHLTLWQTASAGPQDWTQISQNIAQSDPSALSGKVITLNDGTTHSIWVRKITGGANLICFAKHGHTTPDLALVETA